MAAATTTARPAAQLAQQQPAQQQSQQPQQQHQPQQQQPAVDRVRALLYRRLKVCVRAGAHRVLVLCDGVDRRRPAGSGLLLLRQLNLINQSAGR
jgi:hypothetical protein